MVQGPEELSEVDKQRGREGVGKLRANCFLVPTFPDVSACELVILFFRFQ